MQRDLFAEPGAGALRKNGYGVLLVNGDLDRPDAFRPLTEKLEALKLEHGVVVLPDTGHNPGHSYERAGGSSLRFLAKHLKK